MHHVLNQLINRAYLGDHEGRVFRFDAKDHAHFQLHGEAVF
jgi:hypothetical protein